MLQAARRFSRGTAVSEAGRIEIADLVVRYGAVPAVNGVSFTVGAGRACDPARALGLRQDDDLARDRRAGRAGSGGSIRIDGQTVYSAAERRNVPAEKRGVSMVFQSYAVWPHMSVVRQCRLWAAGAETAASAEVAEHVERALGPGADARLSPTARRHCCRAASSSASRSPARSRFRRPCCCSTSRFPISTPNCAPRCGSSCGTLQRRLGITSVYVTHDQEEALAISDRVIVMNVGGIEQIGTPEDIYNRPKTPLRRRFRRLGQSDRGAGRPRAARPRPGDCSKPQAG